ncbi:MAG: hypothetical protein AAGI01_17120 [Myxococcota bacterium]
MSTRAVQTLERFLRAGLFGEQDTGFEVARARRLASRVEVWLVRLLVFGEPAAFRIVPDSPSVGWVSELLEGHPELRELFTVEGDQLVLRELEADVRTTLAELARRMSRPKVHINTRFARPAPGS